jgi:hypothetical protein
MGELCRCAAQNLSHQRGAVRELGSNLGPNAAELGPKPSNMTQDKARRANKIDFLQLPWAQEVPSSNLGAPTTYFFVFNELFRILPC